MDPAASGACLVDTIGGIDMKAEINNDGDLIIEAETEIEEFALKSWQSNVTEMKSAYPIVFKYGKSGSASRTVGVPIGGVCSKKIGTMHA